VLDCASAQGQNLSIASRVQAGDCRVLAVAKCSFAVAGEEFDDGNAGLSLDDIVHIDKAPAQAAGDERPDGAFARAHESGEDDAAGPGCRDELGWCAHIHVSGQKLTASGKTHVGLAEVSGHDFSRAEMAAK
jgi:hypothetical protein